VRRTNDQYFTPEFATRELLKSVGIKGTVFECSHGDGAITSVIEQHRGVEYVWTNDVDESLAADFHFDVTLRERWEKIGMADWVVSNPPFNVAADIIPLAYEFAREGIAMLLRLSFLEPVENRGAWLNQHPPTDLIVLPRISFTGNGKTDSVTCAWMVWERGKIGTIKVAENPRFQNANLASARSGNSDRKQEGFFAS
jgi:hypothetical protein